MDISKLPESLQMICLYFKNDVTYYNRKIWANFRKICMNAYVIATDIHEDNIYPITPPSWSHNFFKVKFIIYEKYKIVVIVSFSPKYAKEKPVNKGPQEIWSSDLEKMIDTLDRFYKLHNKERS